MLKNQSLLHIDATPDKTYPLRILQAYRRQCDTCFASTVTVNTDKDFPSILVQVMNDLQKQRAALLDDAIANLVKLLADK